MERKGRASLQLSLDLLPDVRGDRPVLGSAQIHLKRMIIIINLVGVVERQRLMETRFVANTCDLPDQAEAKGGQFFSTFSTLMIH